jgi:hypothetical protein
MRDINRLPAEHYLQLIKDNKPFSFSRFGDGEVICMFHTWFDRNCDGSIFLPELVEPMKDIFRNQLGYYHCLLYCSFDHNGDLFRKFLEETCPDLPLFDGEIWQELSFSGRITEFVETISEYDCVFVGGSHMTNIPLVKGFNKYPHHLPVPDIDSFKHFDGILREILFQYVSGKRMFLFSAGYTTKILIETLFPHIGHDTFLIDVGSLFDPYVGKLSRSGMVQKGLEFFQPYTNMKLT